MPHIDSQSAIGWITELASDVDISKISDVKQRLLKRCETGHLYWDTYLALQLAGIEGIGVIPVGEGCNISFKETLR